MSQLNARTTILVVEDEPLIRMMVVDSFDDTGLTVLEAEDAGEALALLADHPEIALLLTDVNMPGGMNGLDLAAHALEVRPDLRLVISSGRKHYTEEALPDRGRFLAKPYTSGQLLELVRTELAGHLV